MKINFQKNIKNWKIFINYILNNYLYNVSKYKFGQLNEYDFTRKLLKYKKLNKNNEKYDEIEKELIKIKFNTYLKDLIKDNIKRLL